MGRPSKLTPELTAKMCEALGVGASIEQACRLSGIHKDTYFEWCKRAERDREDLGDGQYVDWKRKIDDANDHVELRALTEIRAGVDNWQSRAWFLERKFPDRWGRGITNRVELSGPNGGPVETAVADKTPADARRVMQEIFGSVTPGGEPAKDPKEPPK